VFHLIRHGPQLKRMLKLKNTPGLTRGDLMMTSPQQEQIGQHRDSHRVRTLLFVTTDLVLAQPQTRFEFPIDEFDRPNADSH